MFQRLIKHDLKENKLSITVIGFFLLITMTLSLAAVRLSTTLVASIEQFVQTAQSPHLLQMHSGRINQERMEQFVREHPEISAYQLSDFVNTEGSAIIINSSRSLQDSSQDNGFSSQNRLFDFLLDKENKRIQPKRGQVYIPLYYYLNGRIKLGDELTVAGLRLTVAGYLRDSQMNAGLVSSKRFLIHPEDLELLKTREGTSNETLIEFRLKHSSQTAELEQAYSKAGLEANGPPMISYPTIKMINGINDALLILVLGLLCLAVLLITFLSTRFALLTKIEEELQQIAVMKSHRPAPEFYPPGLPAEIPHADGRRAADRMEQCRLADRTPKGTDGPLHGPSADTALQLPAGSGSGPLPLLARRLADRSPPQSLQKAHPCAGFDPSRRKQRQNQKRKEKKRLSLPSHPQLDTLFFACKNIISHKKLYLTMLSVISLISLIMLLPSSLVATMKDRQFIQYLGAGDADIRIDISQTDRIDEKAEELVKALQQDPDIRQLRRTDSQNFSYRDQKGQLRELRVSLGNHAVFPVRYSRGRCPTGEHEIALSKLKAEEMDLSVGDRLQLTIDGRDRKLTVVGIYSDLTYGGKTAQSAFSLQQPHPLNSLIAVQLKDGRSSAQKIGELKKAYPDYKLTDVGDFFHQTFAATLSTLRFIEGGVFWVGLCVIFILMLLFVYLIVTKDRSELALCRMLGFGRGLLRSRYLCSVILTSLVGLLIALALLPTLGQSLCSSLLSGFGISQLQLKVELLHSLLLVPLALLSASLTASFISLRSLQQLDIGSALKEN